MAYDEELAERIRIMLAAASPVREVKMFGGLAFMVDERMVVCVRGDGDLLVRTDPARADELMLIDGAQRAVMGERVMGGGWIAVEAAAIASDLHLDYWIEAALDFNAGVTP